MSNCHVLYAINEVTQVFKYKLTCKVISVPFFCGLGDRMSVSEEGNVFPFHFHQSEDWPSELETNMHNMLGAFFNSALLLKYLHIFIQYIMGNAFILFDVNDVPFCG